MNYYQALQRDSDKRWDYTVTNDGASRPTGYCRPFREWSDEDAALTGIPKADPRIVEAAGFAGKHHGDGHATKEEAEACYREYLLDQHLRLGLEHTNAQHKCIVCGEWTTLAAEVAPLHGVWDLCQNHNNRAEVEKLFKAPTYIASSY